MKATINIDDALLKQLSNLTGTTKKNVIVQRGLEALLALESSKRLAMLGGSEKNLSAIPRRRKI